VPGAFNLIPHEDGGFSQKRFELMRFLKYLLMMVRELLELKFVFSQTAAQFRSKGVH
jgi:hypothetical protein